MWIKIKKMGCCLLILILLPYVVTVFINGPVISARSRVDQTYIKVEVLDAADDTSFEELPLEEFGIGVMAGEIPAEYDYYVRVEDAGLSGERLELEYRGDRSMYGYSLREGQEDGYYVGVHFILSLDGHYDHYLRSVITNREYAWDMDDLPLFYTPLWFYSNVTNGVGLVASYARFADVEERVFYKKEEEHFDDLYD